MPPITRCDHPDRASAYHSLRRSRGLRPSVDAKTDEPIVVPHNELAADVLRAVVESFVLREGTDYGEREYSLDEKVARVIRQLERGEAHIVFDPDTESVDIAVRRGVGRL
jgi:uncharacterized protein YheU (UPF0270 family)